MSNAFQEIPASSQYDWRLPEMGRYPCRPAACVLGSLLSEACSSDLYIPTKWSFLSWKGSLRWIVDTAGTSFSLENIPCCRECVSLR